MKQFIISLILLIPVFVSAQDNPDCYADKEFLIIYSTPDYNIAYRLAKRAAEELDIEVNLRNLIPVDKELGLSLPADTCLLLSKEFGEEDYTCYIARGRDDDGIYISIEYSNAYSDFSKGYYIVIAGSGPRNDKDLAFELQRIKGKYSDAYIKTSKVYMCCMH